MESLLDNIILLLAISIFCDICSFGREDARGEDARGEDARGEDATGEDATGEDATGEDATGEDATGEDATGEDATGEDATGEDATGGEDATEEASGVISISEPNCIEDLLLESEDDD